MFRRYLRRPCRAGISDAARSGLYHKHGSKLSSTSTSPSPSSSSYFTRERVALLLLGVGAFTVGCASTLMMHGRIFRTEWEKELPSRFKSPTGPRPGQRSTLSLEDMPTIMYDTSATNLDAVHSELLALLGPERVITDLGERIAHSSTAWSEAPHGSLDRPFLIVCPRTTAEVSGIAKTCHTRRIPMIGFSGGTSLEGTLAAVHAGTVCVDFRLMDKVLALHADDVDVVVQPGVGYVELNEMLAPHRLFFPPDPGPGAKIGGMIAQGCSGTNAFRYGTVKDWVLGLTVVLADGTVVKTRHRPRKSSSGYNLTQLMVGSEGTLGLITEASLKLTSLPKNVRVGVAVFPDTHAAVATAVRIVQSGMPLAAMEMLDGMSMRAVNIGGYCDNSYAESPTLFFKFTGETPRAVVEQIEQVKRIASESRCTTFETSQSDKEASAIWQARKTVLFSQMALKADPEDGFISSDTAVPIGRLAEAVEEARRISEESGLVSAFVGHVGDGNFHTSLLYPAKDKAKSRQVITEIQRAAIKLDGTITGEHGVGYTFCDMIVEELGQDSVDMMRQIKLALDPLCLLNPDKMFKLKVEKSP